MAELEGNPIREALDLYLNDVSGQTPEMRKKQVEAALLQLNDYKEIVRRHTLGTPEIQCVWTQSDEDGSDWETSCGDVFTFIEATPKENGMKFCCYCGLPMDEKLYESPFEGWD